MTKPSSMKKDIFNHFADIADKYGIADRITSDSSHDRIYMGKEGKSKARFIACSRSDGVCLYYDNKDDDVIVELGFKGSRVVTSDEKYDLKTTIGETHFNVVLSRLSSVLGRHHAEKHLVTGSPEWFKYNADMDERPTFCEYIENLRGDFIERFSPAKLRNMSENELLDEVFSNSEKSMIRLLMQNKEYWNFGACGYYTYLGIVYFDNSENTWKYYVDHKAVQLDLDEAKSKAKDVIDKLLFCVDHIEDIGIFESIDDYLELQRRISNVYFYRYAWVLKYYQMIFPQYFPGMYADKTINRALHIIGLPSHGNSERLLNAGEISLFIRKCDVNNIIFNDIYGKEWGWDDDRKPCDFAANNYKESVGIISKLNLSYYNLPGIIGDLLYDRVMEAKTIDDQVIEKKLEGKDRLSFVKTRVNQGEFRSGLLRKNKKCCICGVSNPELLIASHIKPWSECEPDEKLDVDNGLLLCPNHDKLFDSGYISFSDDGNIIISKELSDSDEIFMNVRSEMTIHQNDKGKKYMKYHRDNVFRG